MLQIDLLRHGKTELSHTLRGSTDDALTPEGWQQMQQTLTQSLVDQIQWDVIFSSPLQRCYNFAVHTAKALNLELISTPLMQEMHFGDWEAISTQHLYETVPEALEQFWLEPSTFTPPNAESLLAFEQRVINGLDHIQNMMAQKGYQRALVITHGGVIKLLKCKALKQPLDDLLKMSAELGQLNHFAFSTTDQIQLLEQQQ